MKLSCTLTLLIFTNLAIAQSVFTLDSTQVEITIIKDGIKVPWEITWGPENLIWYTSSSGNVTSLNPETGDEILRAQVSDYFPGGLTDTRMMGLTFPTDIVAQPYAFVSYTYKGANYTNLGWNKYVKVVRFDYVVGEKLSNPMTILNEISVYDGWHVGGKLLAGADNKLYLTVGDAKSAEFAENHPDWDSETPIALDLDRYNGKILRFNFDGSVPEDNPFAEDPFVQKPRNLIWTIGHRNTQGLVFGQHEKLYYAEHGPDNDDEVGRITKGGNYGWPLVEGTCGEVWEKDYCIKNDNLVMPLKTWTPTIAPSNMEYYSHDLITEWKNCLLVGTLTAGGRGNDIRALQLSEDGEKIVKETILFDGKYLRIRDLCVSSAGEVYFITSNLILGSGSQGYDDIIYKISKYKKSNILGANPVAKATNIYPNPFSNLITIDMNGMNIESLHVSDASGRSVYVQQKSDILKESIITSSWSKGLYFVVLRLSNRNVKAYKMYKE